MKLVKAVAQTLGGVWALWLVLMFSGMDAGTLFQNKEVLTYVLETVNFTVILQLLTFLAVVVGSFFIMLLLAVAVAVGVREVMELSDVKAAMFATGLLAFSLTLVNSLFYPLSASAFPVSFAVGNAFFALLVIAQLLFLVAAVRRNNMARVAAGLAAVFLVVPLTALIDTEQDVSSVIPHTASSASHLPNVFVIGIDSLRPQNLAYFGNDSSTMPFLDELLGQAKVVHPAYTPAARTYPAWVSILSGRYPLSHGARFNLTEDNRVDKKHLLSRWLGEKGYNTIWALDDRRYNNIDESYGFRHTVGPRLGAVEMLMTRVSDLPPLNLLVNTGFGEKFLPWLYSSRTNYVTYNPYLFNQNVIKRLDPARPDFLAIHYTAAHHPFLSNFMKFLELDKEINGKYRNYLAMLELADRQLADMLQRLRDAGELDNALVYVISDHGEGFPDHDRQKPHSGNPLADFDAAAYGHGTSVLSLSQFEVLLAELRFSEGQIVSIPSRKERLSTLMDIAPDIVDQLGLAAPWEMAGRSLKEPGHELVFTESSFSPGALARERVEEIVAMAQSMYSYRVNEHGYLRLKDSIFDAFVSAKQRAAVSDAGLVLAVYPDEQESVLVMDVDTGTFWPTAAYVPDELGDWPQVLSKLCHFYKADEYSAERFCSPDKVVAVAD